MELRPATLEDAQAIAKLHADSWRFAYRGALRDAFLDLEADDDRQRFWADRFLRPPANQEIIVASDGAALLGFASLYLNQDPTYGSFLNNLHVRSDILRRGIGRRLLSRVQELCLVRAPSSPLYLWVVSSNVRAQAFYRQLGAQVVGTEDWDPPGGGCTSIDRMVWRSPDAIRIDG